MRSPFLGGANFLEVCDGEKPTVLAVRVG